MTGPPFPISASVADGAYVIVDRLYGDASRGVYRGVSQWAFRNVLVTMAMPQTVAFAELEERLALGVEGIAVLRHLGPLEQATLQRSVMVEDEPAGAPLVARALPQAPADVRRLWLEIGGIVARAHAAGHASIGGLHPELIYAEGDRVTALVPRIDAFVRSAEKPHINPSPLFEHTYQAPEVTSHGRASAAADVFALCALGLHWLTGRHPFAGVDAGHQMVTMLLGKRGEGTAPSTPLGALLERGIAARPEERPSLGVLLEELARP